MKFPLTPYPLPIGEREGCEGSVSELRNKKEIKDVREEAVE